MKYRRTNKVGKFEVKKVKNKGAVSKNVVRVAISPRSPQFIMYTKSFVLWHTRLIRFSMFRCEFPSGQRWHDGIGKITPHPEYCIAGNFRQRKISSKAIVRQFVRNLFSSNVGRRSSALWWFGLVKKKIVRILISSKNCFDKSDEIKFLTKISCNTVAPPPQKLVLKK